MEKGNKKIREMGWWKGIRTEKQDRKGELIYGVEEQEQITMCSCKYGDRVLPICKSLHLVHPYASFFFLFISNSVILSKHL